MEIERDQMLVTVKYKLKTYTAEVPVDATVGFLGKQLSQLTGVVLSTMRLFVPRAKQFGGSTVVEPASELHSSSPLDESGITSGIIIQMLGSTTEELKEVMKPVKENRVLGFAEEEERRRARRQPATQGDAKSRLPKGPYTFHEFRVLELPNVLLNPPPEKARALLYRLAGDPGIVAIMNKHKWQVGILSELAPKGLVGISPKCVLGQNMNRGQDISLRLRTDDLQGFRKFASIKSTLLHELTHMVHDEHDEHFHALDKQLNREAIEFDWTKAPGRTLSGVAFRGVEDDDEPMDADGVTVGHKLGGSLPPPDARSAAVQAAQIRLEQNKLASNSSMIDPSESVIQVGTLSASLPSSRRAVKKNNEPDPDEKAAADEIAVTAEGTELDGREPHDSQKGRTEPDPDESTSGASVHASLPVLRDREPDPDDSQAKPDLQGSNASRGVQEPDPDDMLPLSVFIKTAQRYKPTIVDAEPDPDESMSEEPDPDESSHREEPDPDESSHREEPDPDESMHREEPDPDEPLRREEPDPDESLRREEPDPDESMHHEEPDPDESLRREEPDLDESLRREELDPDESLRRKEPDPDESMDSKEPGAYESMKSHENGLDLDVEPLNEELIRILDASSAAVIRFQQAVVHIRQQATPAETKTALDTLSTLLSNVVKNPNEDKYKVIRKMNHRFQNQVGRFEGAVEFLRAAGFSEGKPAPGAGGFDCYELKTSDLGLLWLGLIVLQPHLA